MRHVATSKDMRFEQKLAQDYNWAEDFEPSAIQENIQENEYGKEWIEPLRTAERVLVNMDLRESGPLAGRERSAVDERLLAVGEAARAIRKVIQMVEGQV